MKKIFTLLTALSLVLGMNARELKPDFSHRDAKAHKTEMKSLFQTPSPRFTVEEVQALKARHEAKQAAMMPVAPHGNPFAVTETYPYEINGVSFLNTTETLWGMFTIYMYEIFGANEEIEFGASAFSMDEPIAKTGDFIKDDFDTVFVNLIDGIDTVAIEIYSMNMHIEEDANGNILATANVEDNNGDIYEISLRYIIPEALRTEDVTITEPALGKYYEGTGYLVLAEDANHLCQVVINSESLAGTFSADQVLSDYSAFATIAGTDTTYLPFYRVTAEGVEANDTVDLTVHYFAQDTVMYDIHIEYALPKLTGETIDVVVNNAYVDDSYLNYYGDIAVFGLNAAQSAYAILDFYPASLDFSGTYSLEDIDPDYSYFATLSPTDTVFYLIDQADFAIAASGTDSYTITGTFICYPETDWAKLTVFTLSMPFSYTTSGGGGGDFTYDTDQDLTASFTEGVDVFEWDTDYFAEYGVVDLYITAADGGSALYLEFYPTANDIPNGSYPINGTYEAPSVFASLGYSAEYQMDIPSYYAEIEGQYYGDTWYFVSGTVTVSDNQIIIAAKNSYDKDINITVNLISSAVETIKAVTNDAHKFMHNGMIKIRRANKLFLMDGKAL